MKNTKHYTILVLTFLVVATQTACWEQANEGTVKVQTVYGRINQIVKPSTGTVSTWTTLGDEYWEINTRSETSEVEVGASTKDNAALTIKIAVTHRIQQNDESFKAYVQKFGLDRDDRLRTLNPILHKQINTETKNVVAQYDAYSLLANQEKMQQELTGRLKPIFVNQFYREVESVQIIGRPDFLDDRIEQAASQVVANQKLKEASQAALEAARIDAERKQVEAQTYANPQLFRIRELELQKEVAAEWAKHQGTLVLGGGSNAQVNIPAGK